MIMHNLDPQRFDSVSVLVRNVFDVTKQGLTQATNLQSYN